jgi:hypothetical protein
LASEWFSDSAKQLTVTLRRPLFARLYQILFTCKPIFAPLLPLVDEVSTERTLIELTRACNCFCDTISNSESLPLDEFTDHETALP